ncbi:TfpX/TfpZ family type IV pilin accessory protein [Acinetobacter higginsii]|uniref:TfpX/TfpZ family type IV pilin accessory protein n=1 Tax=Acinetobacter higginsii TaxID=70347 RepID=UPI001F4B2DCA|nr:TfpX/TfpZ family type IV pilin accessory protein [Acinetobacter higginsii]MCH7295074.1 type IV pilin accessory protein [Acinetobacter higginsii]
MSKRIKFFISHLTISFVIAFIVVGIVFFLWYPAPLAKSVGVTNIFLMMLVIDVIIGPALGLLVYKEGKKTLKMDLTVIILLQFMALSYGVYSIEQGRPAWIVQNGDRFELVRKNEIVPEHITQAKPEYQTPSWLKPQFVAINAGNSIEERNKNLFEAVTTGISNAMRPERYQSVDMSRVQLRENAQNIEILKQFNEPQAVEKIINAYPNADGWLPLSSTSVDMTVLINKEKGEVVKIVDLRPWK